MGDLESAALSGKLFRPGSTSPSRSSSTTSLPNTDDELASDLSGPSSPSPLQHRDGPQTGPKGVIEDRRAHNRQSRLDRDRVARDSRAGQERRKMVALTSEEEDKLREREKLLEDEEDIERWRRKRRDEMAVERLNDGGRMRRGGLREIGKEGFVSAVERSGWVVVLIYEPDFSRCLYILSSLLQLSLSLSSSTSNPISLYRARASTLNFALNHHGEPDLDVLPTMLVYRDGELEHTWIRVDWIVGEGGVEEMLKREGILPHDDDSDVGEEAPNLMDGSDDD